MPVVKVLVNDRCWVSAALDTCSSSTFCSRSLAQSLSLTGKTVSYRLGTLNGETLSSSELVTFKVSSGCDHESRVMSGVKIVDHIPVACGNLNAHDYEHLRGIDYSASVNCRSVDLLIGQDNADLLIPLEVRTGRSDEPYAVRYLFGWALNGRTSRALLCTNHLVISNFVSMPNEYDGAVCDNELRDGLSKLWLMEKSDYEDDFSMSVNDKKVIDLWDDQCRKDGAHYELPIPWKDPHEPIPNNFFQAKKRLESLEKRLREAGDFERYDNEIMKLLNAGYAEPVPLDSSQNPIAADRAFYLPHHNVHNPKKPEKLRVVFDCACKFRGKSLNDRCLRGPDLINSLFDVLLKFRLYHYAIQADIQAMYNQVKIPPKDRDALRFLWIKHGAIIHLRMSSHLFGGIWCSAASTYALRRTIFDHPNPPQLIERAVLESMYVDDCLVSVDSDAAVKELVSALPRILLSGGFLLTKFVINDPRFIALIPPEHRAKEIHSFSPDSVGRALGIQWNVSSDFLFF